LMPIYKLLHKTLLVNRLTADAKE